MSLIIQVKYKLMIVPIVEFLLVLFAEGRSKYLLSKMTKFFFSIFIRDSTNCVLATVCQQFRTRDCRDLHVYLSCDSQPIIESSHNIKFGCLTFNYNQLVGKHNQ